MNENIESKNLFVSGYEPSSAAGIELKFDFDSEEVELIRDGLIDQLDYHLNILKGDFNLSSLRFIEKCVSLLQSLCYLE